MTTRSTEEAMDVLHNGARTKLLIAWGRYAATTLCHRYGTTNSRAVRRDLVAMGILDEVSDGPDHWLGAVFNQSQFKWTGDYFVYSDNERNIHERTIKVWTLSEGCVGYERPITLPPPVASKVSRNQESPSESAVILAYENMLLAVADILEREQEERWLTLAHIVDVFLANQRKLRRNQP